MHSFFHRDNVALPGFSALFKVCPMWMLYLDTAYRRLSLEPHHRCVMGYCMARTVHATVPNDVGLISAMLATVQAATEEEQDHALSLMHQQARIFLRSAMSKFHAKNAAPCPRGYCMEQSQ